MPDIAELPAPADPASGVVCARDNAGESTTSRLSARTADPRTIEVSFRRSTGTCRLRFRDQLAMSPIRALKKWCRKQDSNL
jgi:hypothetical protein